MKRVLIIALCFCCALLAPAQKKTSTYRRANMSTTARKTSSTQQKKISSTNRSTFTLDEIMATFPKLPIAIPIENQCEAINQLKGYEWVVKSPRESKVEIFPKRIEYLKYPSHPNCRVKDFNMFDDKGNLKAVLMFYAAGGVGTGWEDLYAECLDSYMDHADLLEDLQRTAYKNNAYDVSQASSAVREAIDYKLGVTRTKPDMSNETENQAFVYTSQLERDYYEQLRRILKIERIDSTSFNVHYATKNKVPTIVVKYKFYSDGPYKVRYERSFKGMVKKESVPKVRTKVVENIDTTVYDKVEESPSFPHGEQGLKDYLSKNVRYPVVALENEVQGCVNIEFVVWNDGSIKDVKVAKSVYPSLDKEAMRVVKAMPNWIPGKKDGKNVNVRYTIPIIFRL